MRFGIRASAWALVACATFAMAGRAQAQVAIFADGFESGDLSKWSQTSTKGGLMRVSPTAKLTGSYGLLFDVAGLPPPANRAKLWVKDTSPTAESRYAAAFALNLDTLEVPSDPRILRLMAGRVLGDSSQRPFELRLRYSAGVWSIYGVVRDDSGKGTQTAPIAIPKSWVAVSVDWRRATAVGATDGTLALQVESTQVVSDGVANHGFAIDGIQLGFLGGLGLNSTGTAFIDDFASFSYPAPTPTPVPTPTPTPTPSCTPSAVSNGKGGTYTDNCNGTVTDSTTGLIWEKKTGTAGTGVNCVDGATCPDPQGVNNQYTWSTGDNSFNGTAKTVFLDQLNCQGAFATGCTPWLGYSAWRLPAIGELSGIVDTSAPGCDPGLGTGPCINPIFGPTYSGTYVSATSSSDPTNADTVIFYYGVTSSSQKTNYRWLRAVRTSN